MGKKIGTYDLSILPDSGCSAAPRHPETNAELPRILETLENIFLDWQMKLTRCLEAAQAAGELSADADCTELAAFFWIGWEGAVLRARLVQSDTPLNTFIAGFLRGLPQ